MVETNSQEGLAAAKAREVLDDLASRLEADADLRLDISWTLTKITPKTPEKK